MPQGPCFHPLIALNRELKSLEVRVLAIVDVVISKLKPWRPQDRDDIQAMVDLHLADRDLLIERPRLAADWYRMDARESELPWSLERLNPIEYEMLMTSRTPIDLSQP